MPPFHHSKRAVMTSLFLYIKRSFLYQILANMHQNADNMSQNFLGKLKLNNTVFVRFLKNTYNFTRSCAFAQKAKFYALKMLKKQNLTHPKAAKLATLFFGKQFNLLGVILMYIFLRTSRKDCSLGSYAINTPITFSETMHIGVLSTFLIS